MQLTILNQDSIKFIYNQLAQTLVISYNEFRATSANEIVKKEDLLVSFDEFFVSMFIYAINKYDTLTEDNLEFLLSIPRYHDKFIVNILEPVEINKFVEESIETIKIVPEFIVFCGMIDKIIAKANLTADPTLCYLVYIDILSALEMLFPNVNKYLLEEDLSIIYDYFTKNGKF